MANDMMANESYAAGWDWAGDALTWMSRDQIEDEAETVAFDLGEAVGDAEMVHEGILARLRANSRKLG